MVPLRVALARLGVEALLHPYLVGLGRLILLLLLLQALQRPIELIVATAHLRVARLASCSDPLRCIGIRRHQGRQEALILEELVVDDLGMRASLPGATRLTD